MQQLNRFLLEICALQIHWKHSSDLLFNLNLEDNSRLKYVILELRFKDDQSDQVLVFVTLALIINKLIIISCLHTTCAV